MEQKEKFYTQLEEIIKRKNTNHVYLSKSMYDQIILDVKLAKRKKAHKSSLDYRRLKRYDVIMVGEEEKLISPLTEDKMVKFFVNKDELFDIIHNAHIQTGHGGRNRLSNELNSKYKNITFETIMIYLRLCQSCQLKIKRKGETLITKPTLGNELTSRCQVDLIDLQTQPDNDYKFVLNYQDDLTKFVVLRPLKTKTASEVANHLLDIFTLLGAPSILQSGNGREFANEIITKLTNLWDGIKIVHGNQNQTSIESTSQDIQNMLEIWLLSNKSTKWTEGLKFVQLIKNKSFHHEIKQTPYEAFFGSKMKLGLNLPMKLMNEIQTEEELRDYFDKINSVNDVEGEDLSQRININGENVLDKVNIKNEEVSLDNYVIVSDNDQINSTTNDFKETTHFSDNDQSLDDYGNKFFVEQPPKKARLS